MTNNSNINKPPPQGWKRFRSTIRYSFKGLRSAWVNEESFRQELLIAVIALPCAFFLAHSWVEFVLLMGSIMLILVTEVLNSALETIVDRISLEQHELSGRAKDLGSAAAFIAMLTAGGIWISLLIIRILT